MFVVKNGRKLPARFLPSASGGGPAEARAPTPEDVVDLYHGIGVSDLASLMENGFKPTMGAGSDALHNHFGTLVPGVYMAYDFATAMTYPMACTTREKVGGFRSGVQGGTLLAYDGTYPLRAVVRCVAKRGGHLWRRRPQKGNAQALYMPKFVFVNCWLQYKTQKLGACRISPYAWLPQCAARSRSEPVRNWPGARPGLLSGISPGPFFLRSGVNCGEW